MSPVRKLANWAITIGGLVGLGLAIFFIWFDPSHHYTVYAYFANTDGLIKDSSLKVGGVPGGTVQNLQLVRVHGVDEARVTLALTSDSAPIGEGATAQVRPVNLLGEKYVDLSLGNTNKPLKSGAVIPISRTGDPVELDDVLNILDPGTRARLRILINEAGVGLDGQGTNFNQTLQQLPPALDQTQQVVNEVAGQDQVLKDLISQSDAVISTITARRTDLQGLIGSADQALAVTARDRTQIGQTLAQAPSTLAQVQQSLGQLRTTATNLIPASIDLRKAAPSLAKTLATLPSFASSAQATLNTVTQDSAAITRLGSEGAPIVARLEPTVDRLNTFSQALAPNVSTLDNGGAQQLLGVLTGWTKVVQDRDSLGHVFRIRAVLDPEILEDTIDSFLPSADSLASKSHQTKPATLLAPAATPTAASAPASTTTATTPSTSSGGLVNQILSALPVKLPQIKLPALVTNLLGGGSSSSSSSSPSATTSSAQVQGNAVNQLLNYLFGS